MCRLLGESVHGFVEDIPDHLLRELFGLSGTRGIFQTLKATFLVAISPLVDGVVIYAQFFSNGIARLTFCKTENNPSPEYGSLFRCAAANYSLKFRLVFIAYRYAYLLRAHEGSVAQIQHSKELT